MSEADPPETILDGLVQQGRLSPDQSMVLKRVALSPWFQEDDPARTPGGTIAAPVTGDFRTFWAAVPLSDPEQRYTERTQHAKGGMGRVLRAFDSAMRREVAIKELLPEVYHLAGGDMSTLPAGVGANQEAIHRFLNEARITGQLEHPAIVPVYEIGTQSDGAPYYTMKLVRGQSLADAIREAKTLPERLTLLPHFIDLCQAIAFAHSRGVIHRDIKPSNVLLGEFGETLVIDWGLAKMREPGKAGEEEKPFDPAAVVTDSGRTIMGQVLGTPMYMAPEQARGALDEIDERSDVYSLGIVLYEILAGQAPFSQSKPDAVLALKQKQSPPAVQMREKHAPPELAAICGRALDRDPDNRYQSAVELAEEVERFLSGSLVEAYQYTIGQQVLRFARQHKLPLTVTAIALAIIVLVAATSYRSVVEQRDAAVVATMREAEARSQAEAALAAAETARAQTAASEERVRRELYFNTVGLANTLKLSGEYTRARRLLMDIEPDLRGWEWSWLMFQVHPDESSWPVQPQHWRQVDIPPIVDWTHGRVMLHSYSAGIRGSTLHDLRQRASLGGAHTREFVPYQSAFLLPCGERVINIDSRTASLLDIAQLYGAAIEAASIYIPLSWAPQYASDGATALFATDYRAAAVFDTKELTKLREFHTDLGIANALLLAETGCVLTAKQAPFVSINEEALFTLWDIASGAELVSFNGYQAHPAAAARDGHTLALTRLDGVPVVWDSGSREVRFVMDGLSGHAMHLAFAEDAPVVAAACDAGHVVLHDLETGRLLSKWELPETPAALAVSRDGAMAAVGGESGTVFVLNKDGVRPFRGHEGKLRGLSFSPDGDRLAAVDEHDLRMWNLASPGPVVTIEAGMIAAAFMPDGRTLAGFGPRTGGGTWDTRSGALEERLFDLDAADASGLMGPRGEFLLLRSTSDARLVRMQDGLTVARIEGADFLRAPAAFAHDGAKVAIIMSDVFAPVERSHLVLIDIDGGGAVKRFPLRHIPPSGDPYFCAVAFSPGAERIYVAHTDVLTEYITATGEPVRVRNIASSHSGHGNAAAVSPDGSLFVVSGHRGTLSLTNVEGVSRTLPGHSAQVTAIAFDASGDRMVTGAADGSMKLWDAAGERVVLPMPSTSDAIAALAFGRGCGALLSLTSEGCAHVHHVLGWGVDVDGAMPGIAPAERWALYRRLHPVLARPEGLCDVAAQERVLTALGYARSDALGILAPLYPEPLPPALPCGDDYIPSNRLFLHTIAALAERETNPERRTALAELAFEALQRAPLSFDEWTPPFELAQVANELLEGSPPRAQASLVFTRQAESRLKGTAHSDSPMLFSTIGRAYAAAREWEAARDALARVHDAGTGARDLLWAEVHAHLPTEDAHLEAAATLEAFLVNRDANNRVRAVHALLNQSPHESVRARAQALHPCIEPDASAVRSLPWRAAMDAALAEAAEHEGIVMAFVESSASSSNRLEVQPVLSRPDMLAWFEAHTVPILLDAHADPALTRSLGVSRFPALVALNRLGEPIWRLENDFARRTFHEQLENGYGRPGALRVFDVAGPILMMVTDADTAREMARAAAYPAPFVWEGDEFQWVTCPISVIDNGVRLGHAFDGAEQPSYVAVTTVHASVDAPVHIQGNASHHTFVFVNGELLFAGDASTLDGIDTIRVQTQLDAGENQLLIVVGVPFGHSDLRLAITPAGSNGAALRFGPVLNERYPDFAPTVELLDLMELPPETAVVQLHKDYIIQEWRAINADFMRTAQITFVEVDGWGLGVRIGNASEFALTRQFGLRDGDIMVRLNDISFTDTARLMEAFDEMDGQVIPEWYATLIRGGQEVNITIQVDYD